MVGLADVEPEVAQSACADRLWQDRSGRDNSETSLPTRGQRMNCESVRHLSGWPWDPDGRQNQAGFRPLSKTRWRRHESRADRPCKPETNDNPPPHPTPWLKPGERGRCLRCATSSD